MSRAVAGTELSASSVHAIIEIGNNQEMTARILSDLLLLEKSTVSRLVGALVSQGYVTEMQSNLDRRRKLLELTPKGQALLAQIDCFATKRVSAALQTLSAAEAELSRDGVCLYADALRASRTAGDALPAVTVRSGYRPGLIGNISAMHARYYSQSIGFGAHFEATVTKGLADFLVRLDKEKNQVWTVDCHGSVAGSIAIDGEDLGDGRAHLRWFMLEPHLHGTGLGRRLLALSLDFCDAQGFREVHLWTVRGLDAARRLYEANGFVLAEEWSGDQWGPVMQEQKFVRIREN